MTLKFTGERCVPWDADMRNWGWVLQHHLYRYSWAIGAVSGKTVADLGCGSGYGSYVLSFLAKNVIGLDISKDAVDFANEHFHAYNLAYRTQDLLDGELPQAEVYTCFEVLEHLDDPLVVTKRLPTGSLLLWSIPVNDPGRFHRRVYSEDDIYNLMHPSAFFTQQDDGTIIPDIKNNEGKDKPKYVLGVKRL